MTPGRARCSRTHLLWPTFLVVGFALDALGLQRREEALHRRIVPRTLEGRPLPVALLMLWRLVDAADHAGAGETGRWLPWRVRASPRAGPGHVGEVGDALLVRPLGPQLPDSEGFAGDVPPGQGRRMLMPEPRLEPAWRVFVWGVDRGRGTPLLAAAPSVCSSTSVNRLLHCH